MAIIAADLKMYLSGGAGNTDPLASLGGVRSTTQVTLSTLFDTVSGAEGTAGDTEYRCVYVRNEAAQTLFGAVVFVPTNSANPAVDIDIGLGTSAVNGTEQTVANESTAPTSVTFSQPTTKGTGLSIGDMAANDFKAVWIRRTVGAGASATDSDTATITFAGDTGA